MMRATKPKPTNADLERIHDEHIVSMYHHGLSLLRDEAAVRDILQDVFLKLAEDKVALADPKAERAYLLRMVHHAAIDRMRRDQVRKTHAENAKTEIFAPSPDPDREAFRLQLEQSLEQLPAEQREVVFLKLWEERTFEEISGICGIPLNTAASRYRYGIDKLRSLLRPVYEEL